MAVQGLSPIQAMQFQQTRNNASTGLLRGQASNLYQRQLADIGFRQNVRGFNTDWNRRREHLQMPYLQRGIGRSGIYQGGLKRYASDRLDAYNQMQNAHQRGLGDFVFSDRGLDDDYYQTLANSYVGQYGAKADIASKLRGIM